MPEFEIREYQPSDREAVLRLHHQALEETGTDIRGDYFADLNDIDASYPQSGGAFLVGVLQGKMVAMGGYLPRGRETVEIQRMRVDPQQQRRGFGRRMLDALERRAHEAGFTAIRLETTTQQTSAMALYKSRGYREVSRGSKLGFEAVRYEKSLAERPPGP